MALTYIVFLTWNTGTLSSALLTWCLLIFLYCRSFYLHVIPVPYSPNLHNNLVNYLTYRPLSYLTYLLLTSVTYFAFTCLTYLGLCYFPGTLSTLLISQLSTKLGVYFPYLALTLFPQPSGGAEASGAQVAPASAPGKRTRFLAMKSGLECGPLARRRHRVSNVWDFAALTLAL